MLFGTLRTLSAKAGAQLRVKVIGARKKHVVPQILQGLHSLLGRRDLSGGYVEYRGSMPKLYEYFGLIILFYSNEHEPIHVHGKFQGRESKAEIIIANGEVVAVHYSSVKGRRPLDRSQLENFKAVVERYTEEIVQKWIDYFVLHKPVRSEKITGKI